MTYGYHDATQADAPAPYSQRFYTMRDLTSALFRQRRTLAICFALFAAAVVAAVLMSPKVYDAELKILVKRERVDTLVSGTPESDRSVSPDVSEQELLSEVELIQGRDLLEQVVEKVGISTVMPDGDRGADQSLAVAHAVKALKDDLAVAPIKKTWMIGVTYASADPQAAKKVLDELARLYLEKHLAVRRPPGAYQFFSEQLTQVSGELNAAQTSLRDFGTQNHVVAAAEERDLMLQRLAEFEATERQAGAALAETERRVSALQLELARAPVRRLSMQRTTDSTGLIQDLQTRILSLDLKRTELLQKFTPQYRGVIDLDQQLEQTRAALEQARTSPAKEETYQENANIQLLENDIARARADRAVLEVRVRELRSTVTDYRAKAQILDGQDAEQKELARSLKSAEDKFLLYQRKQEEARISDALDRTRIANVAIAQAPTVPVEPRNSRSAVTLLAGLGVGLFLSVAIALAKDALTLSIRTPSELEEALDVPVLGWVPARRS